MKPEMFRSVIGFPNYEVSNYGRVRSWYKWNGKPVPRISKPQLIGIKTNVYLGTSLSKNGKAFTKKTHILVLEAFVGPRPKGYQACHNDGDNLNPHIDNLRWGTVKSNMDDQIKHGIRPKPVENEVTILRRKMDITQEKLGELIGVSHETVSAWELGKKPISKKRMKIIKRITD